MRGIGILATAVLAAAAAAVVAMTVASRDDMKRYVKIRSM